MQSLSIITRNSFQHISGQEKLFDTGKKVLDVLERSYKRINVKCCITHLALVDNKDNGNYPAGLAKLRKYTKFKYVVFNHLSNWSGNGT